MATIHFESTMMQDEIVAEIARLFVAPNVTTDKDDLGVFLIELYELELRIISVALPQSKRVGELAPLPQLQGPACPLAQMSNCLIGQFGDLNP